MAFPGQEYWKPLKCCELISLQLIKINEKKKNTGVGSHSFLQGNVPDPGIEPGSSALQANSLPSEPQAKLMDTFLMEFLMEQVTFFQTLAEACLHTLGLSEGSELWTAVGVSGIHVLS